MTVQAAGVRVYVYGIALMLGCWAGLAVLFTLSRRSLKERNAAAWAGALALPLGLLFARLAFCLLDPNFRPFLNLRNVLDLRTGGLSMYGAMAGMGLAAWLGARIGGVKPLRMLDLACAAFLAFLIPARLGEGFTSLGISRPLTTGLLDNTFLAQRDAYDAYLRTWLLEAVVALGLLLLLLASLRRNPRPGRALMLFCLLYGAAQTLMESLRFDGHMRFSFIGVQQVLSAALFLGALVVLGVRALRRGKAGPLPIAGIAAAPVIAAALVGVEFLIDRSGMGKLASYALFLAVLALPVWLGARMIRMEDRIGQVAD
ncbi:MAG TPA: prolipoprotein diacylglyceryl transferase family protein [Candidatus Limnocylindria bacterium]|nr:prolipoprotein diacylglyceryl transferase family protein [Candidatus Limnocylindria bacterium]